jgi:hypothetical protein
MKKWDTMTAGVACGIFLPLVAFVIYFRLHDPMLSLADVYNRMVENETITYYMSLFTIANLLLFFLFLQLNAERAARGVLGATILYAFSILIFKLV